MVRTGGNVNKYQIAVDACYGEDAELRREFAIKTNEVLPAKGKMPRFLIAGGDRSQIIFGKIIKVLEKVTFSYFGQISIKNLAKKGCHEEAR